MSLTYQSLAPSDEDAFRALADIYTTSIPPAEAKPLAELRAMLARPDYLFLLSRDPSQTPLAFAILYLAPDFTLLEYLATSPARRSAATAPPFSPTSSPSAPTPSSSKSTPPPTPSPTAASPSTPATTAA